MDSACAFQRVEDRVHVGGRAEAEGVRGGGARTGLVVVGVFGCGG